MKYSRKIINKITKVQKQLDGIVVMTKKKKNFTLIEISLSASKSFTQLLTRVVINKKLNKPSIYWRKVNNE
ncbi:hypothetical protein [Staphylococcus shinii]|uniref:hypothetical protein n=1 Tax=Staphylococcus shinii TaxID=2912228 RepID=UPI003F55BE18